MRTNVSNTWFVICKMCGKKFETRYPTRAKYCSGPCGSRYWRRNRTFHKWIAQQKEEAKSA